MPFLVLITLSLYLLSGCSTTSPAISQYTITPSYKTEDKKIVQSKKTLKILTTEALSSLNTKNIRYTLKNSESGSYLYGRWSDTPSMMLNRLLTSSLESEKIFSFTMMADSGAHSDWVLESNLLAYEHRFLDNLPSQGLIDLSCRLIDTKTKLPISAKRFTITINAPSEDMRGGVSALQQASEELTRQQIDWIKHIVNNIK